MEEGIDGFAGGLGVQVLGSSARCVGLLEAGPPLLTDPTPNLLAPSRRRTARCRRRWTCQTAGVSLSVAVDTAELSDGSVELSS